MGERGLIAYFEKENLLKDLNEQKVLLTQKAKIREKLKFGNKDEILIKLND